MNVRALGRYLLTIFILGFLFSTIDIRLIYSHLKNINLLYYAIAGLVFVTVYLWAGLRWQILLKTLDYSVSLKDSVKVISMSYGFNKILPLNSGDLTRPKLMERYTDIDNHGQILGIVAMERILDVILLGLVTIITTPFILGNQLGLSSLTGALGLLLVSVYLLRYKSNLFLELINHLSKLGMPEKIAKLSRDSIRGFNQISTDGILEISVWHSLRWFTGFSVLYILSIAIGSPITIVEASLITSLMSLVSALPITPAGIGPVEAIGTSALVILGLSSSQAAALVIVQRSLGMVLVALIGALVYSFG